MFATCAVLKGGGSLAEAYSEKLPKAKIGRSCINFKKLEDVDLDVLREIARRTSESESWVASSGWLMSLSHDGRGRPLPR